MYKDIILSRDEKRALLYDDEDNFTLIDSSLHDHSEGGEV